MLPVGGWVLVLQFVVCGFLGSCAFVCDWHADGATHAFFVVYLLYIQLHEVPGKSVGGLASPPKY